jgi:hypothetical protein
VQDDLDPGAVAAERLVDGVVDDLPEAVHEPAGVGGPDVHAGALAHRLETLEHRQVAGGVGLAEAGTPAWTIAASAVAGIVGFFLIPVVGFFVGFVGGLLVIELVRLKDWSVAWPATRRALVAVGLSVAVELFAGLLIAVGWTATVVLA